MVDFFNRDIIVKSLPTLLTILFVFHIVKGGNILNILQQYLILVTALFKHTNTLSIWRRFLFIYYVSSIFYIHTICILHFTLGLVKYFVKIMNRRPYLTYWYDTTLDFLILNVMSFSLSINWCFLFVPWRS